MFYYFYFIHFIIKFFLIIYIRGHHTRSWRAGVLQSLAPTLIKHTWTR